MKNLKFLNLRPAICLLICILSLTASQISAQEKSQAPFKVKKTSYTYQIDKKTTDEALAQIKQEVKQEIDQGQVAVLEFSDIQRNEAGELIAIRTRFEDQNGSSQMRSQYSSSGITPFSLQIDQTETGKKYLNITNGPTSPNTLASDASTAAVMGFDSTSEPFSAAIKRMQEFHEAARKQQEEFVQSFLESIKEEPQVKKP